jgi:hypothetical protein
MRSNASIKQQIALRSEYRLADLLGSLAYVAANAAAVVYLASPARLWRYLLLLPPLKPLTVRRGAPPASGRSAAGRVPLGGCRWAQLG